MNRSVAGQQHSVTVFPTHVGMNRCLQDDYLPHQRIPHTRGDEPVTGSRVASLISVFPTHVGMNRL